METNIEAIIQKYSLTVRCLPKIVTSHWSYKEGQKLKENQKVVILPEWNNRKFIREDRTVEKGGWWYVKETPNTDSTVRFNRKYDKFFASTLEEAVQLYLRSKGLDFQFSKPQPECPDCGFEFTCDCKQC